MQVTIQGTELAVVKGDITQQDTEAVVNAANKQLAPGGGVAGAIHKAAGRELWQECAQLGGCATGEAKITKGYQLPAAWIIHTVGPVYSGSSRDAELLAECYKNCLQRAQENNIRRIAFPALSTGAFGYPLKEAAQAALQTVTNTLEEGTDLDLVRFVLFDDQSVRVHEDMLDELGYSRR